MNTAKLIVTGLILLSMLGQDANAQLFKLPFAKAKPAGDQKTDASLTQRSGPWLIMCASFTGDDGRQQAYRLADELRQKHGLSAYVYSHEFNFADEVASKGMGWEVIQVGRDAGAVRQLQVKPAGETYSEEFAVLVGDFPSVEHSRAQSTLERIKTMRPETMLNYDVADGDGRELRGSKLFFAWRDLTRQKIDATEKSDKGPLRAAFLMPNPLLPDEYFEARKVDQAVLNWKFNKDAKYGLLKNKSMYTVKIASFGGESTMELDQIQQKKAEDAWRMKHRKAATESKLMEGYKKAHVLTDFLRKQGIEAYEFHDRHESYVCVGGFDWLVQTDDRGIKRNHPGMVEVINKYKGSPVKNLPGKQGGMQTYPLPKKLAQAGIACDLQPLPVLVPKDTMTATSRMFGRK